MRRYLNFHGQSIWGVLLLFIFVSSLTAAPKPGQAIVKIHNGQGIDAVAAAHNLVVADSISSTSTFLVTFSDTRTVDDVVFELNADNSVELASGNLEIGLPEVNQISQGFPDESQPIFNNGSEPINYYGQAGSYNLALDSAHVRSTGENVVVAVIDNGLDLTHPLMLSSNIMTGHDFIDISSDPSEQPGSIYGHGTFVTGIILLTAPDCIIMPLRAFDGDGNSDQFIVAKAIDWAVRHNADIINMSFGATELTATLNEAIINAHDAGVTMVGASGNDGLQINHYPASHQDVIAVAAMDTLELLADFSNYGDYLDLVAPGVNIYSSLAGDYDWGTWSGTSFATPFVTGTAALVKQIEPTFTPDEMMEHFHNTARTELEWGTVLQPDIQYGYGMINPFMAVMQLSLGDLNASGTRDIADLALMVDYINSNNNGGTATAYGFSPTGAEVDINCDGLADLNDVAMMVHFIFVNWFEFSPCYLRYNHTGH